MTDSHTSKFQSRLLVEAGAPMFLASFFRTTPEDLHTSEEVEFDIEREDEDIAVAVQDLSVDGNENATSIFTNKRFKPPIFKEAGTVNALDTIEREAGRHTFEDPRYVAQAMNQARKGITKLTKKVRRSVELMASQVLSTGQLQLTDQNGADRYVLDFKPKATHIATVSTTWALDGTAGDPNADLQSLAEVVRKDGKREPTDLVFGQSAWNRFIKNTFEKEKLNFRRADLSLVNPRRIGAGATLMGSTWIGSYEFRLWTYNGHYKSPQSGLYVDYINTDHVLMLSEGADMRLTWGGIPLLRPPESRALAMLPRRMTDMGRQLDLHLNAWFTPDGENLKYSVGARPLTIPREIDSFARLDVTA